MKKKATITVERERLFVLSRSDRVVDHWCHKCQANVKMISIDLAAALAGLNQRTVFQLVEAGKVHFVEMSEGQTLFCSNSLAEKAQQSNRFDAESS